MIEREKIQKFCQSELDAIAEIKKKKRFMSPPEDKLLLGKKIAYLKVMQKFDIEEKSK